MDGTGYPCGRQRPSLPTSHYKQINSRQITDLNMKDQIRKLQEENKSDYLHNLWVSKDFLEHKENMNHNTKNC